MHKMNVRFYALFVYLVFCVKCVGDPTTHPFSSIVLFLNALNMEYTESSS